MIICLNGKFVSKKNAKVSVFDHGFLYGDGIYETLRTEKGKILNLQAHLIRLRISAKMLGIIIPWKDKQITEWTTEIAKRNYFKQSRVRISLTRGANGFDFSMAKKPTICIVAQKLESEGKKIYEEGVKAITFEMERPVPQIKSSSFLPSIMGRREMSKKKVYEALLINRNGLVTEGTITNVFMVKNGVLITPGTVALSGTTRATVLKIAKEICPIKIRDIKKEELFTADECFICNVLRGVVPVTEIDEKKIGKGVVGKITKKLRLELEFKIKKW